MAQLPINDDVGSEVVRKLVSQYNALKADFDAYKAATEAAAIFGDAQTDTAALTIGSETIVLKEVPPRNKDYA